ncbi:hypothetical protein PoB_001353200 [Plakobranchus ocellatus]|uniref:Uncharacterized protein n=1 Tax=Plakobranchus ocellatus TaxID=259542 RepID=A0AAV3YXF4_9GAST|nr:hypothetical protein PoB_001353200 [Plakobranchus ocellatus]
MIQFLDNPTAGYFTCHSELLTSKAIHIRFLLQLISCRFNTTIHGFISILPYYIHVTLTPICSAILSAMRVCDSLSINPEHWKPSSQTRAPIPTGTFCQGGWSCLPPLPVLTRGKICEIIEAKRSHQFMVEHFNRFASSFG